MGRSRISGFEIGLVDKDLDFDGVTSRGHDDELKQGVLLPCDPAVKRRFYRIAPQE